MTAAWSALMACSSGKKAPLLPLVPLVPLGPVEDDVGDLWGALGDVFGLNLGEGVVAGGRGGDGERRPVVTLEGELLPWLVPRDKYSLGILPLPLPVQTGAEREGIGAAGATTAASAAAVAAVDA